jgi:branched-subunit amino acid transport protein
MSPVRAAVLGVGAATVVLKATGPVLLGRRELPSWLAGPVFLLAPAVLAAFVVTQAVGGADPHPRLTSAPRNRHASFTKRCVPTR